MLLLGSLAYLVESYSADTCSYSAHLRACFLGGDSADTCSYLAHLRTWWAPTRRTLAFTRRTLGSLAYLAYFFPAYVIERPLRLAVMSEMQPDDLQPDDLKSLKNLIAKGLVRYRWYWKLRWRKALQLVAETGCKDFRQLLDASPQSSTMAKWEWNKPRAAHKWYKYEDIAACALLEITSTLSLIVHAVNKTEIERCIHVIEMIAGLGFLQHGHMGFLELSVDGHMGSWAVCVRCECKIETLKSFECACCDKIWCETCRRLVDLKHSDYGFLCPGDCEKFYEF